MMVRLHLADSNCWSETVELAGSMLSKCVQVGRGTRALIETAQWRH